MAWRTRVSGLSSARSGSGSSSRSLVPGESTRLGYRTTAGDGLESGSNPLLDFETVLGVETALGVETVLGIGPLLGSTGSNVLTWYPLNRSLLEIWTASPLGTSLLHEATLAAQNEQVEPQGIGSTGSTPGKIAWI